MEEAVVKRVMPHSNEAEQAVIGSMLMDADAITTAMEKISKMIFITNNMVLFLRQ